MKIVWFNNTSNLEGASRCLVEAVEELYKRGEENHVICPENGDLVNVLSSMGIPTYTLHQTCWIREHNSTRNKIRRSLQFVRSISSMTKLLKQIQPDLVITNTLIKPCGAFSAKLLGIPHVWYIHEFLEDDHNLSFEFGRQQSLFFVDSLSQKIIVNSKAVYERFKNELTKSKMRVIYNACCAELQNTARVYELEGKFHFNIAVFGRIKPSKGQEEAIRALSVLSGEQLDVGLWLVGDGSEEYIGKLKQLIYDLHLDERVKFIPFISNPFSCMKAFDVILMCSKSEAFGRVTIEAMKLGKAVIGANSGAMPELIQNGWNGLIYNVGDPNSLAAKIELLYKDDDFKKQLESNAYQWSNSNFSPEKYASQLLNVFRDSMNKTT